MQVFVAPRSKLSSPAGSTKVCLDDECELIDTHQLHLNLPPSSVHDIITSSNPPEDVPLILWQRDGLDHRKRRRVTVTLIEINPELSEGHGEMRKSIAPQNGSTIHEF